MSLGNDMKVSIETKFEECIKRLRGKGNYQFYRRGIMTAFYCSSS